VETIVIIIIEVICIVLNLKITANVLNSLFMFRWLTNTKAGIGVGHYQ